MQREMVFVDIGIHRNMSPMWCLPKRVACAPHERAIASVIRWKM